MLLKQLEKMGYNIHETDVNQIVVKLHNKVVQIQLDNSPKKERYFSSANLNRPKPLITKFDQKQQSKQKTKSKDTSFELEPLLNEIQKQQSQGSLETEQQQRQVTLIEINETNQIVSKDIDILQSESQRSITLNSIDPSSPNLKIFSTQKSLEQNEELSKVEQIQDQEDQIANIASKWNINEMQPSSSEQILFEGQNIKNFVYKNPNYDNTPTSDEILQYFDSESI